MRSGRSREFRTDRNGPLLRTPNNRRCDLLPLRPSDAPPLGAPMPRRIAGEDRSKWPQECAAIKRVNGEGSLLRQLNLAPANCFLKNTRRNPTITLQRSIGDAV